MADFSSNVIKNSLTTAQRTYMFEVLIPSLVGGGDSQLFSIRAQASEVPQSSFGAIPIAYKQTAGIVVSGKREVTHEWTVTVLEGEDHKTYDALYDWQKANIDPVTGVGSGDPFYKTDGYIILQGTNGVDNLKIKLKGVWVKTIGAAALSWENEATLKYQVTFGFDDIEKVN